MNENLKVAELLEEQKFMEKCKAADYEVETLRMQQWQKLRLVPRFWKSSMRKAKRKYQRTFFMLRMEIYHCSNRKSMNILNWPLN